jgi:SAM-dependent methyltransferase
MALGNKAPLVENGVVVGNATDKYGASNPITRFLVGNFCRAVGDFAERVSPDAILEVGCGEGHITRLLLQRTAARIHAMDISDTVLDMARTNVDSARVEFENRNIYALDTAQRRASLVVCCEVLEHLDDPARGLQILAEAAAPHSILSVPREPIWRMLNMARGAYLSHLGNSPGHLQHWSQRRFLDFVSSEFEILEVRSPLPWTVVLGRSRRSAV